MAFNSNLNFPSNYPPTYPSNYALHHAPPNSQFSYNIPIHQIHQNRIRNYRQRLARYHNLLYWSVPPSVLVIIGSIIHLFSKKQATFSIIWEIVVAVLWILTSFVLRWRSRNHENEGQMLTGHPYRSYAIQTFFVLLWAASIGVLFADWPTGSSRTRTNTRFNGRWQFQNIFIIVGNALASFLILISTILLWNTASYGMETISMDVEPSQTAPPHVAPHVAPYTAQNRYTAHGISF